MFLYNGNPISIDSPFTAEDGTTFPHLRDPAVREQLGIVEAPDPEWYDQRFYWGPSNPKDLDSLKSTWSSQVKQIAGSLLFPTDWKIVRSVETGEAVYESTLASRAAIRAYSNELETAIQAATTVEALVEVVTTMSWPN